MSNVLPFQRHAAQEAARAIRASIKDPTSAGERRVAHILLSRPRRGLWMATWENLPGLTFDAGRRTYSHALLPTWEYTIAEMKTEMLDDLDKLAATGEQPKEATRVA